MESAQSLRRRPLLTRRKVLGSALAAGAVAAVAQVPLQEALATSGSRRALSLYDPARRTALQTTYWIDGWYSPDALAQINFFMRDRRNDQVMQIDPQLIDILHTLQTRFGSHLPVHIVSGYRSPATNAYLAARSGAVARNSYHMYGRAADIRIPGVGLRSVRQAAIALQSGGVGYYRYSDFVHVDNGPLRDW